ncbi:hypothetical protein, partial [Serratia marcescens]|uniref:hypothetical protein n=1 Tax=Serratia marcescens TaxID=615 RepID=UPI0011E66E0E
MKSLNEVLLERCEMENLPLFLQSVQTPAKEEHIFELHKFGDFSDRYCLSPDKPGPKPTLNGYFLFVILASEPLKIYCGVEAFEVSAKNKE